MLQLRPYQLAMIEAIRAELRAGRSRILAVGPTGMGKTALTAHMIATATGKGKRCWFSVHRRELLRQSIETLEDSAGVNCGVIAAGFGSNGYHLAQVASVQTLIKRWQKYPLPDLVIVDECFVAGTLVDGHAIESLRIGDIVTAVDERTLRVCGRKVTHVMRRTAPPALVRIRSGKRAVTCTLNHPFMNSDGYWLSAGEIKEGDYIYGMCDLWRTGVQATIQAGASVPEVLPLTHGGAKQEGRSRADENQESDAISFRSGISERQAPRNRTQAEDSGWEWKASERAYVTARRSSGVESEGSDSANWSWPWQWLSDLLQVGLRYFRSKAGDRDRRELPLSPVETVSGQEEGRLLEISRVDSVEILERGGDGKFERVCPDGHVYNLEVEGVHTYTANGFVVHNCHHAVSASWSVLLKSIIAKKPDVKIIGLTATPRRLDGRGLGEWFEVIVEGPSTAALIEQGFLAKYRIWGASLPDLTGVHSTGGDYNEGELEAALSRTAVVGDALAEYRKHCDGKRALIFMWSIRASQELAQRFNDAGIAARHVDGDTDSAARDRAMAEFRAGLVKVLTNVDLFGEGLDVPAVEAGFFMRPTQSLGMAMQQYGRILRPFEGKDAALLFDHAGHSVTHGYPDDPRIWTLDGANVKPKKPQAMPIRQCGKCYAVAPISAKACKWCGTIFEIKARSVELEAGELQELSAERRAVMQVKRDAKREQGIADSYEALLNIERNRGYKPGWARLQWMFKLQKRRRRPAVNTRQIGWPK